MRNWARISTISKGGLLKIPINKRGTSSGWVMPESGPRPETDTAQIGIIEIMEGELYALPKISQQLVDDASTDMVQFLKENVVDEFALQEGAAFVNGNNIAKPRGFLTYPIATEIDSVRAFGTLQYTVTGDANGFPAGTSQADCLTDLVMSLRAPYRAGQKTAWMMNSMTAGVISKFKSTTGERLWTQSLQADAPSMLLGYPVAIDENMPDIGSDALPIAFGNWDLGYRIVDRLGLNVLRDPFTAKPYVLFYCRRRVGGGVVDSNAIKLLKISA